jgi:hypothetical protein
MTQKKMVLPVTKRQRSQQEILKGRTGDFSSMIPHKTAQCCADGSNSLFI